MDTEKFKILLKVIETGNFTKTAQEMNMTQSAVSHAISSLENQFGLSLISRGKRKSELNPSLKELIEPITKLIRAEEQVLQMVSEIGGATRGILRIGCFTSISVQWMPDILKQFTEKYPYIQIKLVDGDYEQIERLIMQGEIDCGFLVLPSYKTIESFPISKDKLVVVLPKGHPLAYKKKLSIFELTKEPFIVPGEGLHYTLGELLRQHKVMMNEKYYVKDDYVTVSFIKKGLGFSIMPELIIKDFYDQVAVCELKEETFRTIEMGYKDKKTCSLICQKFIEFIDESKTSSVK